jgi:RHS repeat-associated protein
MKLRLLATILFVTNTLFSQNYHDTQGKLDISNAGQATYTLPIAMPPSIKNVGPVINLVYASGQQGGIAGQGWNISSISSITRIATRKDIDGFVDGVDFDDNDKLALDGQRLILKTGTNYWADGSTYQTEVQSNTKVQLMGSGADIFFIVTAPDGSRSWYGTNNASGRASDLNAFYITRFEDTNGNYITYHYTILPRSSSNCLFLNEIRFSANNTQSTTTLNKIVFLYKETTLKERAYLNGQPIVKSNILDKVEVYTNSSLFRKYQLTHISDNSGYERVSQIQEFNGQLEPANPVVFNYNTTSDTADIVEKDYVNNLNFQQIQLGGDFDGDGSLDFIANNGMYSKLFQNNTGNIVGLPSTLLISRYSIPTTGNGALMLSATTTLNNKLNQFQSIIGINETASTVKFRVHNLQGTTFVQSYEKNISIANTGISSGNCVVGGNYTKSNNEYFEGDFNGDGISEILILSTIDERRVSNWRTFGHERECFATPATYSGVNYSIVDLNSSSSAVANTSGFATAPNNAVIGPDTITPYGSIGSYSRYIADFNGDGKSDMLRIDNSTHAYKIISFKQLTVAPWTLIEILGEGTLPSHSYDKPVLLGDYNGDGKTDLMIPQAVGSRFWDTFLSNPNPSGSELFSKSVVTITAYTPTSSGNTFADYTNYYAIDANKDGKTDIVSVFRSYYKVGWTINNHDTDWKVIVYTNNMSNIYAGINDFNVFYNSGLRTSHSPDIPIPVASNYKNNGVNNELVIVRGQLNKIEYYKFNRDFTKDNQLKTVSSSGGNIVDEIQYKAMEPSTALNNGQGALDEFYSSSDAVNYPFVELKKLANTYLVSKLTNTTEGVSKSQDFKYNGYVVNLNGLGVLGFNKFARSGWYQNQSNKRVWNVTELNTINWRGATERSYTQLVNNGDAFSFVSNTSILPLGIINSNKNTFNNYTLNNVYHILYTSQLTTDYITGVSNELTYAYDSTYLLPTSTVSKNFLNGTLQGTTTSTNEFESNVAGAGVNYYIGRPKSSITESTAYGNTIKASQEFAYTNNRLTKTKKRGNTIDAKYLVEDFIYDNYGNVIKKTLSTEGYTGNILNPRSTEYTYDTSGRFVTSVKDLEGLITTNNTFHPLYGIVLTTTNPFGLATTTEIDNWGKVKKITDYLGKSMNYTYAKSSNAYILTTVGEDGSSSIAISDALGRPKSSGKKNIDGSWSYKNVEYDFLGRKYKESEPYSSGSPTLWNTTTFDDYNRVVSSVASTGLTTNIVYNGTTVTSNDGYKTTSSSKNANGHVVSASDNGGIINYTYYADGSLKTSNFEGTEISMTYDEWNRKKTLSDPSAGNYSYTYYPTGEAKTEETPNGVTTYTLDPVTGKLLVKAVKGNLTNSETTYTYNATSKLLDLTAHNDIIEGTTTTYTNTYDAYQRITKTVENNPAMASFEHQMTYDAFGRVEKELYTATEYRTNKSFSKWIKNTYKNGVAWQILDDANQKVLWQTNTVNAKGQLTGALLGNGINITNKYDQYGFVTQIKHDIAGTTPVNVMTLDYDFNKQRGLLNSRSNSMFAWNENFTYDNLERLTSYTNAQGVLETQVYDNKGRITENNIGKYKYNPSKAYQNSSIEVTAQALPSYQSAPLQTITYNVFKSPVSIAVIKADNIDFVYNAFNDRSAIYYGDESEKKEDRPNAKYYSADGSIEIKHNKTTNLVEFLTYIGGDGYTAPIVLKSDGTTEQYLYLHRDNQSSILAISNTKGLVLEKRLFDAWGNIVKVQDNKGSKLVRLSILDRGYTGHEHLHSVGLIHMNGRLYDPKLHRFLQPDNFVQDPYNTQNYNRYGYVLNNPLKYTDITGEVYGLGEAVLIGAIIAATTYTLVALRSDTPFSVEGLVSASFMGAVSGAVTFGIGTAAASIPQFGLRLTFQAIAHGTFNGMVSGMQGGNFWNGFASGSLSSISSSLWQGGSLAKGGSWDGIVGSGGNEYSTIAFGVISGGAGAALTGGNFWKGAATGLMVSALNHVAHSFGQNDPGKVIKGRVIIHDVDDFFTDVAIKIYFEYYPDLSNTNQAFTITDISIDNDVTGISLAERSFDGITVSDLNLDFETPPGDSDTFVYDIKTKLALKEVSVIAAVVGLKPSKINYSLMLDAHKNSSGTTLISAKILSCNTSWTINLGSATRLDLKIFKM